MKRIGIIVGLFFVVAINIHSKTTYIPTYLSYLHIITNGDTLAVAHQEVAHDDEAVSKQLSAKDFQRL